MNEVQLALNANVPRKENIYARNVVLQLYGKPNIIMQDTHTDHTYQFQNTKTINMDQV